MPKTDDRCVPLSLLQATDIRPVHAHSRRELRLSDPSGYPDPLDVLSNHFAHVDGHAPNAHCVAFKCDALYCTFITT